MDAIYMVKAQIKKFVGKNEVFITPILRFLLVYLALAQINDKIGFFSRIASSPIQLVVALAGSFLPMNLTIVIIAGMILAHLYKLSIEVTIVVLAVFLIMFLLYFRFAAKDSYAVFLTPISFMFKIPYVMPVSMGLTSTPTSMVSVGCGVIVYNIIDYISNNAQALGESEGSISIEKFKVVIDGIIKNPNMFVMVAAFAATILVVYIIRRLPVNYCWFIAIATGFVTMLMATAIANKALGGDVSLGSVFVGMILSTIINIVLQFFVFDLDYQRVEKVQFEDDEYYYYVKAVPKNDIVLEDKKKRSSSASSVTSKPVRKPVQSKPVQSKPVRPVVEDEDEYEEIIITETEYEAPQNSVRSARSGAATGISGQGSYSRNTATGGYAGQTGRSATDSRLKAEEARRAQAERIALERARRNSGNN